MWQVIDGAGSAAMRDVSCSVGHASLEDCGKNGWWNATGCPHSWVRVFLGCSSTYAALEDSPHGSLGSHCCGHSEDVGVKCTGSNHHRPKCSSACKGPIPTKTV